MYVCMYVCMYMNLNGDNIIAKVNENWLINVIVKKTEPIEPNEQMNNEETFEQTLF